jgi:putative endonuclease
MNNLQLGQWGEDIAKDYLTQKGYKYIKRNIRIGRGELDLLFSYQNFLVIVEVKTKTTRNYGDPGEMVDKKKISQIVYLVEQMLKRKNKYHHTIWRVDVIGVIGNGHETLEIIHYENVTMW